MSPTFDFSDSLDGGGRVVDRAVSVSDADIVDAGGAEGAVAAAGAAVVALQQRWTGRYKSNAEGGGEEDELHCR